MLIRPELQITVTALHDGAALRFPKDRTLIDSLKARFPRARWGAGTKSWHIPGKLAAHRADLWAAEQQPYLAKLEAAARDAEWDAPPATSNDDWLTNPAPPPGRVTAADAEPGDPLRMDWTAWRCMSLYTLGQQIGDVRAAARKHQPAYGCLPSPSVHALGGRPGFVLRLPQHSVVHRLIRQAGGVREPEPHRPMPWQSEGRHWWYVPALHWRALRAALPQIKETIARHEQSRLAMIPR